MNTHRAPSWDDFPPEARTSYRCTLFGKEIAIPCVKDEYMERWERNERRLETEGKLQERMDTVPLLFRDATIENWDDEAAKNTDAWHRIVVGESGIIYGGYGCSKTYVGWALVQRAWGHGHQDAMIVTASEIASVCVSDFGDACESWVKDFSGRSFLVIDELDKIHGRSQKEIDAVRRVVDLRWQKDRQTVALANARSPEELAGLVDGAVYDRLASGGAVLHITRTSQRVARKKKNFGRKSDE